MSTETTSDPRCDCGWIHPNADEVVVHIHDAFVAIDKPNPWAALSQVLYLRTENVSIGECEPFDTLVGRHSFQNQAAMYDFAQALDEVVTMIDEYNLLWAYGVRGERAEAIRFRPTLRGLVSDICQQGPIGERVAS